ncbi:Sec-independent protein translocase subunit TatA/TatB [Blattabacterium cuenoti]|uniref:Sec-independent protein translocase subunit TatA/TatB n=1 Tax=Blattabacterium cuenoti TaxID=1653831 RepID=UPI00163CB3C6|nr:twin-arginine translocase TatA/TatE family subunit [Blattabacterium cuenoti]
MKNFLFISIEESFFIIFVAILIFGPKKITDIARELGEGVRYLKNAKNKIKDEIMRTNNINKPIQDNKKIKKPPYSVKRNN